MPPQYDSVQGHQAAGEVATGNPVLLGGVTSIALPTPTAAGQIQQMWVGPNGQLLVAMYASQPTDGTQGGGVLDSNGTMRVLAAGSWLTTNGAASWSAERTPTTFKSLAAVAITAGTPVAAWTPTSGRKFRLMGWMLSLSVAGGVIFRDGGSANAEIFRTCLLAAGVGQSSPPGMRNGFLGAAANGVLNLDVTASGTVSGFVFGTEE